MKKGSKGNDIHNKMNRIKDTILSIQDHLVRLEEQKELTESQTMKDLLEKTIRIACNLFVNYAEMFENIVKYLKIAIEINTKTNNVLKDSISCTDEIIKLFTELNEFVKADDFEEILKACEEKKTRNYAKMQLANYVCDLSCRTYADALYISVLSFQLAMDKNDYNMHEYLKKSVLDFTENTITSLIGEGAIIKDFAENVAHIVNATDKYFLMTDFIGNTDKNLLKLENQNKALVLVYLNQLMLSEIIAETVKEIESGRDSIS